MGFLGDVAVELRNQLRLRYPRRIRVQLGDINLLFDPVGTVLGKKQRLQALGHYYEVITGAAAGQAVTEAYTNCLAYWRAKRERVLGAAFASDAAMEADMEAQLRQFVVEGNALPAVGAEKKVRFPGALTFSASANLGAGGAADGAPLPSVRFNDEAAMWNANTALGKIPIVVTVEKQVNGAWVVAPNEWVHFQLVAPFHDSAAHETDELNALRNQSLQGPPPGTAVAGTGPQTYIRTAMNHNFDAADPQRYNAHSSRGGKRGNALRGNAVSTNVFDSLPAAFPNMNAAEDSPAPRQHAVRAQTNANGEAGVLFMPSRMGGDRYRMRVFIDPLAGFASDGTEAGAVVFETGRFTVYKHILWSNYLPKPAPNFPALNSVEGVQARLALLGYDTGVIDNIDGTRTQGAVRAFQTNNPPLPTNGNWAHAATQAQLAQTVNDYFNGGGAVYVNGVGPNVPAFTFAWVTSQFRQMYAELEIEPAITAAAPAPQLTAAKWREALLWARGQAQANQGSFGLSAVYNMSEMFIDNFETPFLFEVAHPRSYNRRRGAGNPAAAAANNFQAYWRDAAQTIYADDGLLQLFLRYITGNASTASPPTANISVLSTPGLTVVPAIAASRLFWPPAENNQVQIGVGNWWGAQASGIATKERSCVVFGGTNYYSTWVYMPDGYTKNAMHEMGHTLYLRHQFTGNQVGGVPNWLHAGASFREDHDSLSTVANPAVIPPPVLYDRCVMGYLDCEGEFCGKCHLKIRGWDIAQLPV